MGKLRGWCLEGSMPSEDGTAQYGSSTTFSSAALSLSDVAPALQASLQTPSDVALRRTFSRPVVKLPSSEDHKDELLKKILHGSSSSGGTQSSKPPGGRRSQSSSRSSSSANIGSDRQRENSILHELQKKPVDKDALTRREKHMYLEKLRRKGMTHLYATLRSLIPEAKPKTDRCTFLTEAMDYIESLRKELDALARQKSEIMSSTGDRLNLDAATPTRMPIEISDDVKEQLLTAADVAVRFCSGEAFITLNSPKEKGIWPGILQLLQEQSLEPLNVTLSTSKDTFHYHWIHAKVPVASAIRSQDLQKMIQNLLLSHASLG